MIRLHNRYGTDIYLRHLKLNEWALESSNMKDLEYMRIIMNDDDSGYYAFDPPGGPFLYVGMNIDNKHKIDFLKIDKKKRYVIVMKTKHNKILNFVKNILYLLRNKTK